MAGNGQSYARPIVRIAIGGIALGIAVMLITVCIVRGFQAEIRNKVIGFGGHIIISGYSNNNSFEMEPISSKPEFLNIIRKNEEITQITPFGLKNGMLSNKQENEGVLLKGVTREYDFSFFKNHLEEGRLPDFSSDTTVSQEVLLSAMLARKLNLRCGDKIKIAFLTKSSSDEDRYESRSRVLKIAGIYATGLEEIDTKTVLVDLRHIQKLNYWGDSLVGGFELRVKNFSDLRSTGDWVYENTGDGVESKTIVELYPGLFGWLDLMDSNAIIVIVLMVLVAAINMISALLILILENVQMIGILKALGCSNKSVKRIFMIKSIRLTGIGLLLGNFFALALIYFQNQFHFVKLSQESYYMPYVPVKFEWDLFMLLNLGTFTCCLLALYLPGLLISRISPLRSIRFQ